MPVVNGIPTSGQVNEKLLAAFTFKNQAGAAPSAGTVVELYTCIYCSGPLLYPVRRINFPGEPFSTLELSSAGLVTLIAELVSSVRNSNACNALMIVTWFAAEASPAPVAAPSPPPVNAAPDSVNAAALLVAKAMRNQGFPDSTR